MSQQVAGTKPQAAPRAARFSGPAGAEAQRRERLGWLLTLPTLLVVAIVAFYPIGRTFQLSFTNARLGSSREVSFVGLANYTDLLANPAFRAAIGHTTIFTVFSVFFETILGLIIALVIHSNFKGRGIVRTAMLVPWAIPTVVSAQMWAWMYNDVFGVVNDLLFVRITPFLNNLLFEGIGMPLSEQKIAWIANTSYSLPAIIAVDVWKTTPFMALLLLAGLQVIPGDVYEAAHVDGASKWQQFWRITLPLLRPALVVALIFRTLDAFRVFDVIYVMKGSSPDTVSLAVLARQTLFDLRRVGEGSAMSVIIFLILAVFVIIYTRLVRVEED